MKFGFFDPSYAVGEARRLWRILALYSVLGALAGLIAVGFSISIEWASQNILARLTGIHPLDPGASTAGLSAIELSWPEGRRWFVVVVPALGALVAGLLCARVAPETMGGGINHVIAAYHRFRGIVRSRVIVVKSIATALVIGSGGSAGSEGPIAQIGASVGAALSNRLKLSTAERRILIVAGMAAGIGAIFHAPMAAALFAAEILYSELDLEYEVLVASIIASTVSYGVYGAMHNWEALFVFPPVHFDDPLQLIPYTALALVLAVGAGAFVFTMRMASAKIGNATGLPLWVRPAIGALGVGLIGLWVPQVLGTGYGIIEMAVYGKVGAGVLLLLAVVKGFATALTVGSGGSGGDFAPALVIGAALGGVVGIASANLAPDLGIEVAAFVVVGMAGFFAAVSNTLLATVIMVSEVVGSYRLLVPSLWVCLIAWLLAKRSRLFSEQVPTRMDAPAQLSDMMGAVLLRIRVSEAISPTKPMPQTVPTHMPMPQLVHCFSQSTQSVFPIISGHPPQLVGVVDGRELRRHIGEDGIDNLLIAADFLATAVTVTPQDTLHTAISRMMSSGYDELIITADHDDTAVVGVISRREVIAAYHRRMLESTGESDTCITQSEEISAESSPSEVDLQSSLKRGGILTNISGANPTEVIENIVGRAELPDELNRAELLELLVAREKLGSTGIGGGIALPHPNAGHLPGLESPRVIFALLERPIDWQAVDGKPVHTVCVVLAEKGPTHLRLLGALARVLGDPVIQNLLQNKAKPATILRELKRLFNDSTTRTSGFESPEEPS
ncbi:MAG: chloride channel protein [Myxococcales bacterium]|nr:chloride channel protein [Myxococcales bacterium]